MNPRYFLRGKCIVDSLSNQCLTLADILQKLNDATFDSGNGLLQFKVRLTAHQYTPDRNVFEILKKDHLWASIILGDHDLRVISKYIFMPSVTCDALMDIPAINISMLTDEDLGLPKEGD